MDANFSKSILRSLVVDGGVDLANSVRLVDLLAEFSTKTNTVRTIGNWAGASQVAIGLALVSTNPVGMIVAALGAFTFWKSRSHRLTMHDKREILLLNKHRRLIQLLGYLQKAQTGTEDEILSSYESFIGNYDYAQDAIIYDGNVIPAAQLIEMLPGMVEARHRHRLDEKSRTIPTLPSHPNSSELLSLQNTIGIDTQIGRNVVDVPLSPQQQDSIHSPVTELERAYNLPCEIGLPKSLQSLMIAKPYSTFIFGQSEAGKDITLYNVMSALKRSHQNAYFLGIDGKNSPSESALWSGHLYDQVVRISMRNDPATYHASIVDALQIAIDRPGTAFIAFSEINGIAAAYGVKRMIKEWDEVAFLIAYLAIQGNSERKFLYGTAQALNLDALGIKKESRSNVYFLAIANSTQFGFLSQMAGDTNVFSNKLLLDQSAFQSACSRSTATQHLKNHSILKGIGYFHTALNRWEPMPRLENPGLDRGEAFPQEQHQSETTQPTSESKSADLSPLTQNTQSKEVNDRGNVSKPPLSRTELMLAIAELGEWLDRNQGLSFDQSYSNYNARRKGLSRPEFRYLLTQIEQLDAE
ncbi:hypothetical protein [Leptolyngbya sp. NIES-2104]|uniref:hypothetical protein n=1 Tax=Leptolyngbya sp. NIES-2104 TaxID=1552121 RepID=UPI0006ECA746|nr:hypothetical protein [Leptolyngbya sp. NIES-2104]GAQ00159.1 hypothetical protein NIES2104_67240 [Leptolyngbya sp. NIES-2104]